MELKKYQEDVLDDLREYIDNLLITKNPSKAYNLLWMGKGVRVGYGGMPTYKDLIPGVPSVCLKVPTGGGKTLIGCAALKTIFDRMSQNKKKVVVWLVPWDSILTQTYNTFSNKKHFYRERLDRDFSSKVEIYNKKQVLSGINFNPSAIDGQLSLLVVGFDSLRSKNKDGRKVYEENSNLAVFKDANYTSDEKISGVDDTALMQILNSMNPVVVIDESHNATSDLSLEMVKNLNPSFVVQLTATPKNSSNIISIVSAERLKQENMVKLPVIAYNRPNVERVIVEAIDLRNNLEKCAIEEQKANSEIYIRPIVLFQAQPKNDEDNITFEKLKENLISCGIPKEQIAIKTSLVNELKDVDLMSKECPIRYIVTVNALKEGWDCPFAYILASIANKSSAVDVEQILGRILRQPNQRTYSHKLLNMSYVLSSSNDFNTTLQSILKGLNTAGFSKNDCRAVENLPSDNTEESSSEQMSIFENEGTETQNVDSENFNIESVTKEIKQSLNETEQIASGNDVGNETTENTNSLNDLIDSALSQNEEYELKIDEYTKEDNSGLAQELVEKMNKYKICNSIADKIKNLKLPQFCIKVNNTLFEDELGDNLVSKDDLTDGFSLTTLAIPSDLATSADNVFKIDVESNDDGSVAKQFVMRKAESEEFKSILQQIPEASRVSSCKSKLIFDLNKKFNCVKYDDLVSYVERIVSALNEDQLVDLQNNIMSAELKIKNFIDKALDEYRYKKFKEDLDIGKIFLKEMYEFPTYIYPAMTVSQYPRTMYSEEDGDLSDVEIDFVTNVSALENVVCWHRIIEKKGFCLNGYLNHYPDFVVLTESGKVVLVETKGEHLANDDSKLKLELGKLWSSYAGQDKYKYFMAFQKNAMNEEGSYLVDKVIDIIKNL